MASLAEIRAAVRTTITTAVTTLHGYDKIPDKPNLPALIVLPLVADFAVAMGRGTDTYEFDLIVLVPYADAEVGQAALDPYVTGAGAASIRQAIWNAKSLGRADCDAHVRRMDNYGGQFEAVGVPHIGAKLRLVVHTTGTA